MSGRSDNPPNPAALGPVDPGVGRSLALMTPGDWVCVDVAFPHDDAVKVKFVADQAGEWPDDWLEVHVFRRDAYPRVFHSFEHCAVRYRANVVSPTNSRRHRVGQLVMSVGASVDAALGAAGGDGSIAEALGAERASRRLTFGRDAVLELLHPQVALRQPLPFGWALVDLFPATAGRDADGFDLTLEFAHGDHPSRLHVVIGPRREGRPAFLRTAHFHINHYSTGTDTPAGTSTVLMLLGLALRLSDHNDLEVTFPSIAEELAGTLALQAPSPDSPPATADERWLNLAVSADCGQDCAFCSARELRPPGQGVTLARLSAELRANREAGITRWRLNGYDPLAWSGVLDLLDYALKLGLSEIHVFSPCTRLADEAFAEAVFQRLPEAARFFVPLYGTDASTHDAVVGTPGAFEQVMAACDRIEAELGAAAVHIQTVVTQQGLAAAPDIVALARGRGWSVGLHLPFPSRESRSDRFFTSAPRQTEVAETLAKAGLPPTLANGVAPCVAFRVMDAREEAPQDWLSVPETVELPGTGYRSDEIVHRHPSDQQEALIAHTVPCPVADRCVLAQACPKEMLAAYVTKFGLDEFRPVSLGALLAAARRGDGATERRLVST